MNNNRLLATMLAVAMVLSLVAVPGAALADTGETLSSDDDAPEDGDDKVDQDEPAADDDGSEDGDETEPEADDEENGDGSEDGEGTDLSINVTQSDGIVVTITDSDGPVDADVNVSTEEDVPYVGDGDYETDDNGEVSLPAPVSDEVEVTIEAATEDDVTETTATLEPNDAQSFGDLVSAFVQETKDSDYDGPLGLKVAGFVVEHNPGNAPDHAGPPAHVGPPGEDNEKKGKQGPPEHAGGNDKHDDSDKRGPPNHGEDDETVEEEPTDDEANEEETADDQDEDESTEDESSEE